ncbi:palmitoyltransferase ZDHHC22-like [Saccoglossus kowalevskii]|uniref:Palmitoyltransferase n=1 Tax=Saccoglossus kowalevskii TaxID=10224 RepID=A0ABM0MTK1_SACKO|nr:PREDICTED: palmitoyltransferase ZDHHC22-like [Saccoglossus kowalevskii]
MGILSVLRHPTADKRLTLLALMSIGAVIYFNFVTLFAMSLATLVTIPHLFKYTMQKHYIFAVFMFVNTYWNYLMAYFTDTTARRLPKDVWEFHQQQKTKPVRCYSCKLCGDCIVKRDHHCFFMNTCIGYYNQKYFMWYCLYMSVGTFYSLITTAMYNNAVFGTQFNGSTTFFTLGPKTVYLWLVGRAPLGEMILVTYLYVCLAGGTVCLGFFCWQLWISFMGLTTFEAMHDMPGINNGFYNNMTDVLGKFWILGAVFPICLPQHGNGIYGDKFGVMDGANEVTKKNALKVKKKVENNKRNNKTKKNN